jgi:tRNA dimethylallyltransferase
MKKSDIKLIVILGPTASGKSDLGIHLARRYDGEIVSVDSRQVYRALDIGTGKVTKAEQKMAPHHLLDIVAPGRKFSIAQFKKYADRKIADIWKRGKIPFLVGGSALYIKAVVENYTIPPIKEDATLRRKLEKESLEELVTKLEKIDPVTFEAIDKQNKRRVVRALEVCLLTGKPFSEFQVKGEDRYDTLFLGIDFSRDELYRRIDERVDRRVKRGMFGEVSRLINEGISKKWLKGLGLEYRFLTEYLEGPLTNERKEECLQRLKYAIHDFARRQLVWWRKDTRINWIHTERDAIRFVSKFLT